MAFIDDFSRYCCFDLLKIKDEVFNKFKIFEADAKNHTKRKIKILRSDKGGKYSSNELTIFCEKYDIIHEVTTSYFPQSSSVTKWKSRTLLGIVNAMIISSGVLENL